MSRTASIIAEMRAENAAALNPNAETVEAQDAARRIKVRRIQAGWNVTGQRYGVASAAVRADARITAGILLRGTQDLVDRNNVRRDCSLPKRALGMASTKGRVTPDMATSLLAFFQNPASFAQAVALSILPESLSAKQVTALCDSIGLTTDAKTTSALLARVNPATPRNGGASHRCSVFTPGVPVPPPAPAKRGRPSGLKRVESLEFGPLPALVGCDNIAGIPFSTADGEMAGAGFDQGAGWETARTLTPAQVKRRNVAYTASAAGFRTIDGKVVERWT